eukprot:4749295-Alexandrium_andersonii.AAC.1
MASTNCAAPSLRSLPSGRAKWPMAARRERSKSWRETSQPTGHQSKRCSLPNSPTPQSGQGSEVLPPAKESKWQRPIATRACPQQGGPASVPSMPRADATQLAPSRWTSSTGKQALHQAIPGRSAEGVVKAIDTWADWQHMQVRGRASRTAVDRVAASPWTPFPMSRHT